MSEPDFRIGVDEETDLVARIAARGSLLRHARFLRRARPHDRQRRRLAAPGKIFPIIHPGAAPASRAGARCSTPATRRRSRSSRSPTRKRASRSRRGDARDLTTHRRRRRRVVLRAVVTRADRVSELELHDRARRTTRSRAGRRCAGRAGAAARRRALSQTRCRTITSIASRSRSARRSRARAACIAHRPASRRRRRNVRASAGAKPPASRWSPGITSSAPTRAKEIVGKLAAYPEMQGLPRRPVVSRPRHLGDGDHAADAERAGVAGEADGLQADDLHHRPAARQRGVVDEPHPAAGRAARHRSGLQRRS